VDTLEVGVILSLSPSVNRWDPPFHNLVWDGLPFRYIRDDLLELYYTASLECHTITGVIPADHFIKPHNNCYVQINKKIRIKYGELMMFFRKKRWKKKK